MSAANSINATTSVHPLLRLMGHLFSYLFHPLFVPMYVTWFLLYVHPAYFAGFGDRMKGMLMFRTALNMVFFPLITVLLLKAIGFIDSIFLKTQKDRIIPYIASGIFFFWAYLVYRNQPEIPVVLTSFTFAVFLSSSVALMANIYFKISMHAIGMGGVLGLFLIILQQNTMLMTVPISIAILLTGLVCTSRLVVSDHSAKEIYAGLAAGLLCQLAAAIVIMN